MSTALITMDAVEKQFPLLSPHSAAAELLAQNLAGEELSVSDLDRIKVPAGGGTNWTLTTVAGEESAKSIEGIILHVARRRAYWRNPNPTNEQPDCSSTDCITGHGDPGGACAACPLNQFGTATKQGGGEGRGKACKESTLLFFLRQGAAMPDVVVVPPGSLKAVKHYRMKLPVPYFSAVTRLELVRTTNKDGIAYAQIKPTYAGELPGEVASRVKSLAESFTGMFATAGVERDDVGE